MRIPPKVEKHNLDLEWPDTPMGKKVSSSLHTASTKYSGGEDKQHPLGPYIDIKLSDRISTVRFESAVLRHFEVLHTS
jgi:hypothetical protein